MEFGNRHTFLARGFLHFYLLTFFFLNLASATPLVSHDSGNKEHIVIFDNASLSPLRVAHILEGLDLHPHHPDVRHVFNNSAFQGFAARLKPHHVPLLANMPGISLLEQATTISRGSVSSRGSISYDTRTNAPWGLQLISSSSAVSGSSSALDYTYGFTDSSLGAGSDIYIIDTGVYTANNVFGGRASMIWSYDGNLDDLDGHGTHVSGTAAGAVLGVASNANLFGVKALAPDGTGWSSNVVAAIDFVIQHHESRQAGTNPPFIGSVISMSLASSSPVSAINSAVNSALAMGVHVCAAAGNDNQDACESSPASTGGTQGLAITVGAVDMNMHRASFSNSGKCVDVYAPGVDVISAWIGAPNMINLLSGTSMATPHVAGIVAYAMALNSSLAASPSLMKEWVRSVSLALPDGSLLASNDLHALIEN